MNIYSFTDDPFDRPQIHELTESEVFAQYNLTESTLTQAMKDRKTGYLLLNRHNKVRKLVPEKIVRNH